MATLNKLNAEQMTFVKREIIKLICSKPNKANIDYIKEWDQKFQSSNNCLEFILQKLYPITQKLVLVNCMNKYPELDYSYTLEFLGLTTV